MMPNSAPSSPLPAIDSGLLRDVYVSLGESLEGGKAWAVRVYYKPFVGWIWAGCLLMAAGGFFAAADRRYRLKLRQPSTAQTTTTLMPQGGRA